MMEFEGLGWRRQNLDSLDSDGSIDGEMDKYIEDVLKKNKKRTKQASLKKKRQEEEEDNISEEKVKMELRENEKEKVTHAPPTPTIMGSPLAFNDNRKYNTKDQHPVRPYSGHWSSESDDDPWSSSPEIDDDDHRPVVPSSYVPSAARGPPGTVVSGGGGRGPAAGGRGNAAGGRGHVAGGRGNAAGGRGHVAGGRGNAAGGRGNAAGGRTPSDQVMNFEDDDEGLRMKADQEKALTELRQYKLDLHKARYTDEEPPEYDVAERVRQLNQALANSPTPVNEERTRSIKFKDNLVDLVAPPPDYPSDDESGGQSVRPTTPTSHKNNPTTTPTYPTNLTSPPTTPTTTPNTQKDSSPRTSNTTTTTSPTTSTTTSTTTPTTPTSQGEGDNSVHDLNIDQMNLNDNEEGAGDAQINSPTHDTPQHDQPDSPPEPQVKNNQGKNSKETLSQSKPQPKEDQSNGGNGDQVLVERDGTFELINVNDLTAEERDLFLGPSVSTDSPDGGSSDSGSLQPTPPRHPRPATATVTTSHRRAVTSATYQRRAQSATTKRPVTANTDSPGRFTSNYQSPYAIPDHLKKIGEKKSKEKEERERQEKQLRRMEEDQKKRENEEAFLAWKNIKRKSELEERLKGGETRAPSKEKEAWVENDEEEHSEKSDAAFNEWMKAKRNQQRREQHEAELLRQEEEHMMTERPRQESDKAFRQWVKKKNQETKKAKKQEVSRARISKLMVRRTRKAMQLARAIQKSQTFRYVDYYGYRF